MRTISKKNVGLILVGLAVSLLALASYDGGSLRVVSPAMAIVASEQTFVAVDIDSGKKISINGEVVALEDFDHGMIKNIQGDRSNVVIDMTCKANVPMAVVFDVQKKLVAMELTRVIYRDHTENALPLELPTQDTLDKMKSIPAKHITSVSIDGNGAVTFDGMDVNTTKLAQATKQRVTEDAKTIVSIHVQDGTKYSDFMRVLSEVKKGGAQRILLNNPGESIGPST
ncbi:MAG: biopolymer transporter ExbD [Candidatus Latescibacterota bacterium]|nr:MAG: biopolymer transporter ExbD [Candidatus Latescibacterota bacterium]